MPAPLPLPLRRLIQRRAHAGQNAADIARDLHLCPRTVRQRLQRFGRQPNRLQPDYQPRPGQPAQDHPFYAQALTLRQQHPRWGASYLRLRLAELAQPGSLPSERTLQRWFRREQQPPADAGRRPDAEAKRVTLSSGGRPRKTDLRAVVNAILYILRTGCQWRYLPKDFPPKSTVWRYFDQWRRNGILDIIHDLLRKKVRTQEKPSQPRTTASVDSQSVDSTSGGEQRGRDNAKNVDGRKRHIVVDSTWACCWPCW